MAAAGRLDVFRAWPAGFRAMMSLEKAIAGCDLEGALVALVETRASQRNGCAFCLDRHRRAAAAHGVSAEKLADVSCWACSDRFDARERAALALTDALAEPAGGVSDALLARARLHFGDAELAQLVYLIATINAWNRLAVADRTPVASGC